MEATKQWLRSVVNLTVALRLLNNHELAGAILIDLADIDPRVGGYLHPKGITFAVRKERHGEIVSLFDVNDGLGKWYNPKEFAEFMFLSTEQIPDTIEPLVNEILGERTP